jgi:hypothetical protein
MYGKGLKQGARLASLDPKDVVSHMEHSWGQPRRDWKESFLGPFDAWHDGADWEKTRRERRLQEALADPVEIKRLARRMFEGIRTTDYRKFLEAERQGWPNDEWRQFGGDRPGYRTATDVDGWRRWICETFDANPIASVELGDVFENTHGLPAVPYVVTLQDGSVLKGDLPFNYSARSRTWSGEHGIDWHRKYADGLPKEE